VTDDGRALLIAENRGFRYVRFGFTGRALDANDLPMIGAVVTINSDAGSFSTTTDGQGYYRFNDLNFSAQAGAFIAHVDHPEGGYAERIFSGGRCHSSLEPAPCVSILEPADGALTDAGVVTVRGVVTPKEVDYTTGTLLVNGENYTVDFHNNEFTLSGVGLKPGKNTLTLKVPAMGPFQGGGSLPVAVERISSAPQKQSVAGMAYDTDGTTVLANVTVEISVNGIPAANVKTDSCGYYTASGLPLGAVTTRIIR
jgi:hypothetical protein